MNEYNLSLRLQYAVVVAIWSRKKSEYSLEKPLEMLCVCVRLLQTPPRIYLSSITVNSVNSSLNLSALLLLLLRVCSITVKFLLGFYH